MKISGFTMGKNVSKLYYPIKPSIQSILPLVDEFIVVLGDSDIDDTTRRDVESIADPKIKIIDTIWDIEKFPRGMEHAHQTDIAKSYCSGDWLFYLQADEVVHEKDLAKIKLRCEELLTDFTVEGLLFNYYHFWGDYSHFHDSHGWYRKEIRIIRNDPSIHSWESAQSFRRIPEFDGIHYRQHEGTIKLNIAEVDAHIYHYGWVRPPAYMKNKIKAFKTNHKGKNKVAELESSNSHYFDFDYGDLNKLAVFKGSHPAVMQQWIENFNWSDDLLIKGRNKFRLPHKHEKLKYRLATFIEKYVLFGHPIGEFKNYKLLRR
jgi:hypothetical protein